MTASTPSARIRAAAEILRERAGKAIPGPWELGTLDEDETPYLSGGRRAPVGIVETFRREDVDWIATTDPAVGLLLADVLDEAADHCERGEDPALAASELALADAITGRGAR